MRALVLLLSLPACGGHTKDDDSYQPRDDSGTVPDDSATDDSATDDSATNDDSTPPDDSATSLYGLDERPSNPTCLAPARPASDFDAEWEAVFPALSFDYAIQITHPPGDDSWLYVVQQDGKVYAFENRPDVKDAVLVLDKTGTVGFDYAEKGLLSIAFHPDFPTNGAVFLAYDSSSKNYVTRITSAGIGERFDDSKELTLLDIDDPASNHNGGQLAFGPDGYLYVATGDGGGSGDTYGNGQNPDTLLAKILRLDVDGGDPYAIPADNPWADGADGVPEMFAWGFRNPWRFQFDPASGDLWVGDVGQNKYEEVDLVNIGGNYGWPIREGAHCYGASTCDDLGFLNPILDYDPGGAASVIMGPVYRGSAFPALVGTPLFTDFYATDLQGLFFDEATSAPEMREVAASAGVPFAALGTDEAGEVYGVDYYTGGGVYQLVPSSGTKKEDPFPDLLSETGCVDPKDPTVPATGLVPYAPNAAFWSDGADKLRWFAIPDGTTVAIEKNGDFTFPIGTVMMKQFSIAGTVVETRLFVRHDDGNWAGYSYAWNGADATWARGGSVVEVAGQEWTYPSAAMCLVCHSPLAGGTLGPELGQLNGDLAYPSTGRVANQLRTLDHIGILDLGGADPDTLEAIPDPFGSEDVRLRARAWLHTNCSFCHQPGGLGGGDADYRYTTPGPDMNICDVPPMSGDLGIADARILAPGDPDRSVLLSRISRRDAYQMPPLASSLVDEDGAALIREWNRIDDELSVSALVVEDLSKSYKQLQAVDSLSFEVRPGDVLALVGPNGAGKTTTMRTVAGIIAPTKGRIRIDGFDIVAQAIEAKRRLAYVPDDPHLFDALTVEEHLVFAAAAYRVDDWRDRAEALLARFDLTEHRTKPAIELSRGMRQKVAICCAYLHRPALVMLDEPLTGLDPRGIRTMKETLVEHAASGAAVIVSSHLLQLVEDLCTVILILHQGKRLFLGNIDEARHAFAAHGEDASLEEVFFRATEGRTAQGGS